MASQRRGGGILSSSIFTLGLVVIVIILLMNYWMLLNRNGEAVREAHKLRQELQQVTLTNIESLKKLESCKTDNSAMDGMLKSMDEKNKKKETVISDVSEQLQQMKKIHDSMLEEKKSMSEILEKVENEKTGLVRELQMEKTRCKESELSLVKDCADACDKKVTDTKNEAEKACEQRFENQKPVPAAVAMTKFPGA